jgi:hypothetical protein
LHRLFSCQAEESGKNHSNRSSHYTPDPFDESNQI